MTQYNIHIENSNKSISLHVSGEVVEYKDGKPVEREITETEIRELLSKNTYEKLDNSGIQKSILNLGGLGSIISG